MNSGIDYGRGLVNVDTSNGIRYGVINSNEVMDAWYESAELWIPEDIGENDELPDDLPYVLDDGEYKAESDSYGDIFILKSPYYTMCGFCSPCAPGAGDLSSKGDVSAYCFGHDFFENGVAPYPVYSVETGEIVNP